MNSITPITIEWNCYNGFIFEVFHIDSYKPINLDAALFGISASERFLYIDIFFITLKIFDKNG
jgi:hypothetical protein